MDLISGYLKKFQGLLNSAVAKKQYISESVTEVTGVPLESKNCNIQGDVVYLKISPATKQVVFINKQKILEKIREKSGGKDLISDIR